MENSGQSKDVVRDQGNVQNKPLIIIAGDSMGKGPNVWIMSRTSNVKVYSFSGATTHDVNDFLNPLLSRKPSNLILHLGTNDLAYISRPTAYRKQYSELCDAGHTTW